MQPSLSDRVALVTGAAHRVGKAIALALAAEGVHLVIHYHGAAEAAQETVRDVKSHGVDAFAFQADQSDPRQVNALFDAVREHYGRLDILVNSANMFKKADFLSLTYEDWQRVIDVNLTGPFLVSQAAARLMLAETGRDKVIVNILDNSALQPWPGLPHHSVAKAGLLMLAQVMARRLGPQIRVNSVSPGPVLKTEAGSDAHWARLAARLPLQRAGSPEDVGRAVVFLAREDFITGAILNVDGGELLVDSGADVS